MFRIGSDEDDDEIDESQSMEDPSETAVSRDAKLEHTEPQESVETDTKSQLASAQDISQDISQDDGSQEPIKASTSPSCDADGTVTEVSPFPGAAPSGGTEMDNTGSETHSNADTTHQVENHLEPQVRVAY